MIPFFDLSAQYEEIKEEVRTAVDSVFASSSYILGARLDEFERAFAGYLGRGFCAGVNSGTDAIHLALASAGVEPGDGVVTVPNTAVPTVAAIRAMGARPYLVDIDPATYTMDPEGLEDVLRELTSKGVTVGSVVPVHLYGLTADMDAIVGVARRYGVPVVEDACQAHGAEYRGVKAGTIGDLGCFSFYPTKNLGAYGDAGAVVTGSEELDQRVRLLRNYGQSDRYHASIEGFNSRLDEVQAAVLSVKLKYLDRWIDRRRALAAVYDEKLDPERVILPIEPEGLKHAYHLYVIRHVERDKLREYLAGKGVGALIHYPVAIHMQEAYTWLGYPEGSFPEAERAAREILSIPIFPELDPAEAEQVASLINAYPGPASGF
jgi:dTDP-4-amino-4,6-dideoxygalactose transaminase